MGTRLEMRGSSKAPWKCGDRRDWREAVGTLLKERARACQTAPPTANPCSPDPIDAAREREEEAVWLAVMDRRHDVHATVEEALRRLATGEYGVCADCGHRIAVARLRAMPFAVRCLACQERFEREEEIAARKRSMALLCGRRITLDDVEPIVDLG